LIESYGMAYDLLIEAIAAFPREMWQFRAGSEEWTIHEILVHIADSEVNSYVRCRRLIAEPGSTVLGYDEMTWARVLDYHQQSVEDALELFKWLRRKSYLLVRGLEEGAWSHVVTHSESGPMILEDWLRTYERHVPEHIEQMSRVYAGWLRQKRA
jgi:hypothetical protein